MDNIERKPKRPRIGENRNTPFRGCSLLVEVGSDANTLEEAVYTGKCIGVALSEILKEYDEGNE